MRALSMLSVIAVLAACAASPPEDADAGAAESVPVPEPGDEVESDADAEPAAETIQREVWKDLGVVIDPARDLGLAPTDRGWGVSDIKVVTLDDGTYLAIMPVRSVPPHVRNYLDVRIFTSPDLRTWTPVEGARWDIEDPDSPHAETIVRTPDGGFRSFRGEPIIDVGGAVESRSSPDGITWTVDSGYRLTGADFDRELRVNSVAVVERPEGGWRMYVAATDCTKRTFVGDPNCPDAPDWSSPDEMGLESVFSAVSEDLLTWTVEPGVRFDAGPESGSITHIAAWVDDESRYHLAGTMTVAPPDAVDLPPIPAGQLGWLSSDDGLEFSTRLVRIPTGDVQVLRGPDGQWTMLHGGGTPALHESHIRLAVLETVSWELGWPIPVRTQHTADDSMLDCLLIEVRGEGTLELSTSGKYLFEPGTANPDWYEIRPPIVEAPGVVYVNRREEHFLEPPEGVSSPRDRDDFPMSLIVEDADGVREWLGLSVGDVWNYQHVLPIDPDGEAEHCWPQEPEYQFED